MGNGRKTGMGLTRRMIGTALVGLGIMAAAFYVIFAVTKQDFLQGIQNQWKASTELSAKGLNHEISVKIGALKTVAEAGVNAFAAPADAEEWFQYVHKVAEEKYFNHGIFFVDPNGAILNLRNYGANGLQFEIAEYLKRGRLLKGQELEINTVVLPSNLYPLIATVYPLKDPQEGIRGYVIGAFDGQEGNVQKALYRFWRGKSGYTNVVNEEGLVVFSTRPDLIGKKSPHFELARPAMGAGGAIIREEEGTMVAVAPLEMKNWYLLIEQQVWEYYAPVNKLKKALIYLFVSLIVVAVGLTVATGRALVRPLLSMSRSAEKIAMGNLDAPLVGKGPGEVGVLADSMELMRWNLKRLFAREEGHKVELEREVSSKTERLRLLNEMSLFLSQTLEVEEVIQRTLERCIQVLGACQGSIYLLEKDGVTLRRALSAFGTVPDGLETIKRDEGLSGLAIKEGRAVAIESSKHPDERMREFYSTEEIKTAMGAPLSSKGRLLGTLTMGSKREEIPSQEELDFLDHIASMVGTALENALLFRQLSQAKWEWESTFDSISDLIIIEDLEGKVARANMAVFEFFGLPPGEVIGRELREFLQERDASWPEDYCPLSQSGVNQEQGRTCVAETLMKGLDFRLYYFAFKNDEGELKGMIHVARNVTEEKKLMKALEFRARSTSLLNELTKAINSSLEMDVITKGLMEGLGNIFDVDRTGIARYNQEEDAFSFKIYRDRIEVLMVGGEYNVKAEAAPTTTNAWKQRVTSYSGSLKESSEPFNRQLHEEGLNSYLLVPVLADGEVIASIALGDRREMKFSQQEIAFLEDLADHLSVAMKNAELYEGLKKAHEELKRTQQQLIQAEKLSSIGRLAAGTAHEILNPLNIISMQAQMMAMDLKLTGEQRQALSSIGEQVARIKKIADGLRVFSRAQRAGEEGEVEINRLLQETLDFLTYDFRLNNILVEKDLHAGPLTVIADKGQLAQVFVNIMLNARDAMPGGGTLAIKTGMEGPKRRRYIKIEFSDTGTGIPEENLPKIFDPFFTTKAEDKGTGLGLAICYGIVQNLGGRIYARSKVGEGATFIVELPAGRRQSGIRQ